MRACRDFAYESRKNAHEKHRSNDGKNMQKKHWAMRPTIPSTWQMQCALCSARCMLHAASAMLIHSLSIWCILHKLYPALLCSRCCGMHHISLQIGKQNDVASTLNITKTAASRATNRMLHTVCTRCAHTEKQIAFASQQLMLLLLLLLLAMHSIYHRVHSSLFVRSTVEYLNVAWFCCYKMLHHTPCGVNFASIRMHFNSFFVFFIVIVFRCMQSPSNKFDRLFFFLLFFFISTPIEIVRHDSLIQTWTIRFNLNGILSVAVETWNKLGERVPVDRMGFTRRRQRFSGRIIAMDHISNWKIAYKSPCAVPHTKHTQKIE